MASIPTLDDQGNAEVPGDSPDNPEEPKHSPSSLWTSEEGYRRLFDGIRDSILVANLEREIIALNPAFTRLFGYTLDDLAGRQTVHIYEKKDEYLELGRELRENLGNSEFLKVVRFKKKNGEVFSGETNVFYFTDRDGSVLGFIGLIRDITQRLAAEEELAETKALLQAALDHSPVGIAIADAPDGRLRYVNRAGLLIRGESAERVVTQVAAEDYVSSWQLLDLDGTPLKRDEVPLARAVLYGEENAREFIVRRSDEEDRIVRGRAAPIRSEEGQITSAMVVFDDITERKQAEDAVREKTLLLEESRAALRALTHRLQAIREQEREELARDLHDELGEVLTLHHMDLGALRDRAKEEGNPLADSFSSLLESSDKAMEIIREHCLQLYSPVLDLIGVGAAIRSHAETLQQRTPLTFEIQVAEEDLELSPEVAVNVYRIAQEALTNALRHSRATTVWVTFGRQDDGRIFLEVVDDGIGVPPDREGAHKSMGILGMKERALVIGGQLSVEPSEKGGTAVRMILPLTS